ncbi:MAG: T9SS type A sorting domain-containing protein [Flavobacteriaceae bacterium]|nr:T9SS type A sorting domain-containing protein [Flavobacteriaceae bacterium]
MNKKIALIFIILFAINNLIAQNWTQIGEDIDGETMNDQSGWSVSLSSDGSIMAVGARYNDGNGNNSGHVRIYQNQNGIWTQLGQDIDGEAENDEFGYSISLSSNGLVLAIGAPYNNGNGHVRIYRIQSGVWTQIGQDIEGESSGDWFGWSVSLSSDGLVVAIGASYNDGNGIDAGHVRIYQNQNEIWTQFGTDIDGETSGDFSGSVSLNSNGSVVAIGARRNDGNGTESGHVRVYHNQSGVWTQIGQDIDGEDAGDRSGRSVSLSSDGSVVAIGAFWNDGNGINSGHVRIYKNQNEIWTQIGTDIDGEASGDNFGNSVSLSSDGLMVAIGAFWNDGNGIDSGHTRIYQNQNEIWIQIGEDINGEAAGDASGGWSVSLSSDGSVVAIGAPKNDGNGIDSGHVRVFKNPILGVSENNFSTKYALMKNPVGEQIRLKLNSAHSYNNVKYSVFNTSGQQIISERLQNLSDEISINHHLNTGIYFLNITDSETTYNVKIIVN